MKWPLQLAVLLAAGPARAAWPDDVSLSSLAERAASDPAVAEDAYRTVVNELGVAIANKPLAPAETLGVYGFDVGLATSVAFIHTRGTGGEPSAWERVHQDMDPTPVMVLPSIQVRKGLPFSLEAGGSLSYIAVSRQAAVGGYGRWALVEGYRPIPDVTVQLGYTGYVGNQELELGVMDMGVTVGYTLPFGTLVGINQAVFSPYLGGGVLVIHAEPRLDPELEETMGLEPVSGFKSGKNIPYDPDFRHPAVNGGFRIVNNDFEFRLAASYAPQVVATLSVGMGFAY